MRSPKQCTAITPTDSTARYESIDHRTIRIIMEMHPLTVGNGITFKHE